jgi:Protein of unknown function (DUF4254)
MPSASQISTRDDKSFECQAFEDRAAPLTGLQDQFTAHWHREPGELPSALTGFERAVVEQHLANFELWHAEDSARTPGASDCDLARIKRFIDVTNQRRNDLAERCDALLLTHLAARNLPVFASELHSESPGLMIDRLSILSLKLFHTVEEIERVGTPPAHTELNRGRLLVLNEQRDDLAGALDRLWHQVLAGERRFKLYRQLKMYNDPALNPAVYGSGSGSST